MLNAMRNAGVMAGNPSDDDALYRAHYPRILRLCRMMLNNPDDGDEVAQEVFVKMIGQRNHGPEPANWSAWLTRVAINGCRDRRRSGWWRWWGRDGRELLDSDLTTLRNAEDLAISRQEQGAVWRRFKKLSPRQQEVFVLRHVEGWSTREVAEALNLSAQAVKLHLFRATHHLREAVRSES